MMGRQVGRGAAGRLESAPQLETAIVAQEPVGPESRG